MRQPDLVYYLSPDWEAFHHPKMVETLARHIAPSGAKVLCVNRPAFLFMAPHAYRRKWGQWLAQRGRPRQITDNLYVYTPVGGCHELIARWLPGVTAVNRTLLAWSIVPALRRIGADSRRLVTWITCPHQVSYLGVVREAFTVYECYDAHADSVALSAAARRVITGMERELLKRADLVFTTSAGLFEKCKVLNPNTHVSLNAADVEYFARTQNPTLPVADFMCCLRHPIVGYLGTIHRETDIGLLKYVAEARPGWTIVMIGPVQDAGLEQSSLFREFIQLANVRLTGWLSYEALPSYCKAFDVCVIPYRMDSAFNQCVNPLKLHEYTAMGKPVVTTRIPEVGSHKDLVWITDTPEQFVAGIEEALRTDSPAKIEARLKRAQENSWDVRVQGMLSIIQGRLGTPDRAQADVPHNHRGEITSPIAES